MEYKFYNQIEYRKFIRTLDSNTKFKTVSKPFELPIILIIEGGKNPYNIYENS